MFCRVPAFPCSRVPAPLSDVEDDPRFPHLVLSDIEVMIGGRLHVQVKSMALGIDRFSCNVCPHPRAGESSHLETRRDESPCIQQQEATGERVDEQTLV